jgi:phenylacetic acid degradation protein paaN
VLAEAGFDPNLVALAAEDAGEGLASTLATRPEVGIVDFTGSTSYGNWLEDNARQAQVYTEKAGVNAVVLDSTDDYAGLLGNLAFSLSLYSGQMCTTPQNLFVPAAGIGTDQGPKPVAEFAADLGAAVDKLLGEDAKAVELLGAIVNDGVLQRLEQAPAAGEVLVPSRTVKHPTFPDATVRTPTVVGLDAADEAVYGQECFGPVAYLISTGSTTAAVAAFKSTVDRHGALTAAVYTTDPGVLAQVREAALEAGVALSENLTGGVFVNQSAAFSDFHATGANPAANATYTDGAFVAGRFRVVQSRRHLPAPAAP